MIKKLTLYTLCLLPWFLTSIIPIDYSYYDKIIKPGFAPPNSFYAIAWTIIYLLLAYTIYSIFITYKRQEIPGSYYFTLVINYLFNQGYTIVFFNYKNTFLGFVFCVGTLLSTLFLFEETSLLYNKKKFFLIPYILLSIFASIFSLSIYVLNI